MRSLCAAAVELKALGCGVRAGPATCRTCGVTHSNAHHMSQPGLVSSIFTLLVNMLTSKVPGSLPPTLKQ